jgi:hypothetical protein
MCSKLCTCITSSLERLSSYFLYIYPSVRDYQKGFDVLSPEYLPLALFGFYGFALNLIAFVTLKKWEKIKNEG